MYAVDCRGLALFVHMGKAADYRQMILFLEKKSQKYAHILQEIDASLDRVSSHFKRSVSDADPESGIECGGAH